MQETITIPRVLTLWQDENIDEDAAKILRRPAAEVSIPLDEAAKRDVQLLIAAFLARDDALGLAAPQIAVTRKIIVFRTKHLQDNDRPRDSRDYEVLINPRISQVRGELVAETEGCLSCPQINVEVMRYPEIKVRAHDATGRKISKRYTNFLARIVQHEIDHLAGTLIIDYAGAYYTTKERAGFFAKLLGGK